MPAFLGGTRPRATLTVDGRSISYNEYAFGLASLWDIGQIEVFRSPQTTTQGRNSIAGAIFVETRDPVFDWESTFRVIDGNYATHQISAAVSGPLADKALAFRLSGDLRRSRTSSHVISSAVGADPNRDDFDALRFKLLTAPGAIPDSRFELTVSHVDSEMPQIEGVTRPYRERRNADATYGIFQVQVDSVTGVFDYQPSGPFAARLTTSYGNSTTRRFAPPGLGESSIGGQDRSIEVLINWTRSRKFRLTGGVHLLGSSLDQTIDLSAVLLGRGTFADRQRSTGVFGESDLALTPKLTLTTGLRLQRDRQERLGGLDGAGAPINLDYDGRFRAWLPKVTLAYQAAEELRFGMLVQRAYNPGGATINLTQRAGVGFGAESLWDYELFVRAGLAGGALQLSGNLFHYDMIDSQRPLVREFSLPGGQTARYLEISNAPHARSQGLEAQAEWRVNGSLTIGAAIGLLNTRITATPVRNDPMLGKEFQRSPHFSSAASIDWKPVDSLQLSAQLRHNSSYFSDDTEAPMLRVGGSTTVDARVGWQVGSLEVFGYMRNAFDEFHLTYLYSPSGRLATAGEPRELGIGLAARF